MRKILMLLAIICLNGCALFMMDSNLDKMRGRSIDLAYDVLGYPQSSGPTTGGRVYYWRTNGIYTQTEPRVADSRVSGAVSFAMRTYYNHTYSTYGGCIIKIKTNYSGIITYTDAEGYPPRACMFYADKLQEAFGG